MRGMGRAQSKLNPHFCELCVPKESGGAEVEISMLFADVVRPHWQGMAGGVRSSSGTSTKWLRRVLVESDAMVDRLVGDEVVGLFIPGWAGRQGARRSPRPETIEAAFGTAKGMLPVGIGVHAAWRSSDRGRRDERPVISLR
jgi:adenylate cyclase